jgi:hypothetical protein
MSYRVWCKFLGSYDECDSTYPTTYEGLLGALARINYLESLGGRAWSYEIEREHSSDADIMAIYWPEKSIKE